MKNRDADDSFELRMETTTLHAHFEGIITVLLRKSCGSAEPYRQEKLRARALHDEIENERGGPMLPPGCCSRLVLGCMAKLVHFLARAHPDSCVFTSHVVAASKSILRSAI